MICESCATAADNVTDAFKRGDLNQPTGHDPSVCDDVLCTCQHLPIKPKETDRG
jgi:hypothetical protein